jgi:RNA-directed DNA polymerase
MTNLFETKSKTVPITKEMVWEAYKKVKANKGGSGIDKQTLELYASKLSKNLYKLWNRLASGSYFPKPVKEVTIPKSDGGQRKLGIPTIDDRIAQEVLRSYIEPRMEAIFIEESYGYRPHKSAHDAVKKVRSNVYKYAWVIDMDIKSFFDEVNHELLMKAVEKHCSEKWIKIYIQRWLESPIQKADGTLIHKKGQGTPQGGVISPLLANLYLHYVIDVWLKKNYPLVPMVRYADDVIIHCFTESEAQRVLQAIRNRMQECKLRLNEEKTQIVYCKTSTRTLINKYSKKFDFLGFTYKPTMLPNKRGKAFLGTGCSISQKSISRIVDNWKKTSVFKSTTVNIQDIATVINPQMRGIIQYYGKINLHALRPLRNNLYLRLAKWVGKKYKSLRRNFKKTKKWIASTMKSYPTMFYHWTLFEIN